MNYVCFLDESGNVTQEAGISDEVGPSQYMSMGACLVREDELEAFSDLLEEIKGKFKKRKNLHATDLSHVQKIHLARELVKLNARLFGVVSDKTTLRGFKAKSDGAPQDYYNRTALYILSLVGRYLREKDIDGKDVKIIFEHRDHDYQRLRNYIGVVKRKPSGDEVKGIQEIDHQQIGSDLKSDCHHFAIPDLVAHSIFSAFDRNRNNFGITEIRYLSELMPSFIDDCGFCGLHLIQPNRMKEVCEPTTSFLNEYGFELGAKS